MRKLSPMAKRSKVLHDFFSNIIKTLNMLQKRSYWLNNRGSEFSSYKIALQNWVTNLEIFIEILLSSY